MLSFAIKSVKQSLSISKNNIELIDLMNAFKSMVNDSIRIGLVSDASSLKRLSTLAYRKLQQKYGSIPSYYWLTAISKASGILASRKKSLRRGIETKDPYLTRPLLISCYNFKIKNESLNFRIGRGRKFQISLSKHTLQEINKKGIQVRSFTITRSSLSLSIKKEIALYTPTSFVGIDRNALNITCGNKVGVIQFGMKKIEAITNMTGDILRSFTKRFPDKKDPRVKVW